MDKYSDAAIREKVNAVEIDYSPNIGYVGVAELGVDRVIGEFSFGSYQGDSYILGRRGEEWGFQTFGWGSCSGCDALEACSTHEELYRLAIGFRDGWHWEKSADELYEYLVGKDWEGLYSWNEDEEEAARKRMLEFLQVFVKPVTLQTKRLFRLGVNMGYGTIRGLFISSQEEVDKALGRHVYLGEVLGKHSEVGFDLEPECLRELPVKEDTVKDLYKVLGANVSGYNPLNYIEDREDE